MPTTQPRLDPGNSPPHAWLEGDPYRTADHETPRLPAIATRACQCVPAPGLEIERQRLAAIGGRWLGTCGDANHTYGYHVPACRLSSSDYSMRGAANRPANWSHGCAIDIGMGWPAARAWLRWLIHEVREDRITGIAEIIGSYDGRRVRYWSDTTGWTEDGVTYTGTGHDTWTHVAVYRSTAQHDHRLLAGWTATSSPGNPEPHPEEDDMPAFATGEITHGFAFDHNDRVLDRDKVTMIATPPVGSGLVPWGAGWISFAADFGPARLRVATHDGRGWALRSIDLDNTTPRAGWALPHNTGKVSVGRVKRSPTDNVSDTPVAWLLEYDRR